VSTLLLHAGAAAVPLSQVEAVPTPAATKSWQPIAHIDVVRLVEQELQQQHLRIVSQEFALWRDGSRFFGLMELRNGQNHDDYALVVGIRNSHDKSFPAGAVLGSRVFVCDNLAFSGEVKFARKHTTHILRDLPALVNAGVARLLTARAGQERRIEAYKGFQLSDMEAHDVMVRAAQISVAPITRLSDVIREWHTPQHPEFQPRTAWSLFNAFTEALKGGLAALPARTQALHGLMDKVVGFQNIEAEPSLFDAPEPVQDAEFEVVGQEPIVLDGGPRFEDVVDAGMDAGAAAPEPGPTFDEGAES
jgi:hypothetical protein